MIPGLKKRAFNFHGVHMYAALARKHLRLGMLLLCLALVVGLILSFCVKPVYYSRSLVRVEERAFPSDTEKSYDDRQLRMVMTELTQSHLLERTAARLGIKATNNDLRKKYLFKTAVHASSERNLEVEVWTYSKEWARNWTEALVDEYLDFRREEKFRKNQESTAAPSHQVDGSGDQLGQPAVEKFDHADRKGATQAQIELSRIQSLPMDIARLNKRIDEMSRLRINLQDPSLNVVKKLTLISSLDKSVKLEGTDRELEIELQSALKNFDGKFRDLLDQKAVLEARLPEYNEMRRNNPQLVQGNNLNGAVQSRTPDFAAERESVGLAYGGLLQLNNEPVSPNRWKILLFSLLVGGLLAVGAPLFIEYFDQTISSLEQVETTLQIRGLGIVPKFNGEPRHRALMDRDGNSALIESFRVIRTNLLSIGALSKAPHVTMITSALPKEGKTIVSSNLAMSFAQTETRTLLIDTDLRRGRMHRLFGYRKVPGLSNVLLDEVSFAEAIRPTPHKHLFVLVAGRHLDAGTVLLGSDKFGKLIAQLREEYDRIVVDTPPVLGLQETSVLRRHVDGVLFVIRSNRTPIRTTKAAIEVLQSNSANFYGLVLNHLDLGESYSHAQFLQNSC